MATAYGFIGIEDLFNQRVSEVGVTRVYTAISESLGEHTRNTNGLLASLVMRTTVAQEQFELPGGGTLQPLDEDGNPLVVLPSGNYKVAYPIQGGGTAWGGNRVTNALLTVEEANRFTMDAMDKDANWLRRHIMAALLDDTTWTYKDRVGGNGAKGLGDITIQPLANGDAVVYVKTGGDAETDDHYLAQAAAIGDAANPFDDIFDDLMEHPSNAGGPVIVYIPTALKLTTRALAGFIEMDDPDIQVGDDSSRIIGQLSLTFGDELLGKTDDCWIVEWRDLPDEHMIAHATGGGAVLKMREYPSDDIQGFFPETHSPDGNHNEVRMIRLAGFGASNRIGALVYQVGNATYEIPSGFNTPLPV